MVDITSSTSRIMVVITSSTSRIMVVIISSSTTSSFSSIVATTPFLTSPHTTSITSCTVTTRIFRILTSSSPIASSCSHPRSIRTLTEIMA